MTTRDNPDWLAGDFGDEWEKVEVEDYVPKSSFCVSGAGGL